MSLMYARILIATEMKGCTSVYRVWNAKVSNKSNGIKVTGVFIQSLTYPNGLLDLVNRKRGEERTDYLHSSGGRQPTSTEGYRRSNYVSTPQHLITDSPNVT